MGDARRLRAALSRVALVDRIPFAAGSKVVGFGSSTTDDLPSWFEILCAVFEQRRPQDSIRFVNAGISGDTTTHEIARMNTVVNERPDWIICHISSNDGRRHGASSDRQRDYVSSFAQSVGAEDSLFRPTTRLRL